MKSIAVFAIFALSVVMFFQACSSGDSDLAAGECKDDGDCGQGYVCEYQQCKRFQYPDGDGPKVDGDQLDGDGFPDGDPPVDGDWISDGDDDGTDSSDGDLNPDGDATDGDQEQACTPENLDPQCGDFTNEHYCRDDTVRHSIWECRSDLEGDRLYLCDLVFDCSYPNCGSVVSYRRPKTCVEGCVSNQNPQNDDYCAEDGPPDGDEEDVDGDFELPDGDMDVDMDIEDDNALPDKRDGYPCTNDDGCLPGHSCRLDFDGHGKYCALTRFICVYHVDIPHGESALFYEHGDRLCTEGGFKRCSSGTWIQGLTDVCQELECTDGVIIEAQSCDNGVDGKTAECLPTHPNSYACPEFFACLDDTNLCRSSCSDDEHCRAGYICLELDSECVCDGGPHCE